MKSIFTAVATSTSQKFSFKAQKIPTKPWEVNACYMSSSFGNIDLGYFENVEWLLLQSSMPIDIVSGLEIILSKCWGE